jgi:acetyl esterase/lipase
MIPDRRNLMIGMLVAGAATAAGCATEASPPVVQTSVTLPEPDLYIWGDHPPGHPPKSVRPDDNYHVANPGLFIFRPERSNGVAILMFQGGGYERVGRGPGVPTYFAKRGYTVFDMRYRLPHAGWEAGPDVTLQDAQQGLRLIRSRAAEFGVRADRVGVMGFSSGGHMASYAATAWARDVTPAGLGLSDISTRPDFACLGCPVVTMSDPYVHRASRQNLFGDARDPDALRLRSPEMLVTPETPPMFMVHAGDDRVVSPNNSLILFSALRAAGVAAELHIFEKGGHNMGAGFAPGSPLSSFPDLMLDWMSRQGFPGKNT